MPKATTSAYNLIEEWKNNPFQVENEVGIQVVASFSTMTLRLMLCASKVVDEQSTKLKTLRYNQSHD